MIKRETAEAIDDAAAAWVARLDRAPLTPAEAGKLKAWLAVDPRRRGAFARARAVMISADRARTLGAAFDGGEPGMFVSIPQGGHWNRPTRRWALGGALAASLVAGAMAVGFKVFRPAQQFETQRGEVRRLPLTDGSVLTLNTATRVAVSYSADRRDIHLIEGEALFDVAKNAKRPFFVDAGDVRVRAVGTSFSVRKLPGRPTQVLVSEGVVEISRLGAATRAQPVRVKANELALATGDGTIQASAVESAALTRELMWREGMIAFEGQTLRDAVEEFSRYSDPPITIDDPRVARETITGLFAADNPGGFAQAVALSLGLKMRTDDSGIHLRR